MLFAQGTRRSVFNLAFGDGRLGFKSSPAMLKMSNIFSGGASVLAVSCRCALEQAIIPTFPAQVVQQQNYLLFFVGLRWVPLTVLGSWNRDRHFAYGTQQTIFRSTFKFIVLLYSAKSQHRCLNAQNIIIKQSHTDRRVQTDSKTGN